MTQPTLTFISLLRQYASFVIATLFMYIRYFFKVCFHKLCIFYCGIYVRQKLQHYYEEQEKSSKSLQEKASSSAAQTTKTEKFSLSFYRLLKHDWSKLMFLSEYHPYAVYFHGQSYYSSDGWFPSAMPLLLRLGSRSKEDDDEGEQNEKDDEPMKKKKAETMKKKWWSPIEQWWHSVCRQTLLRTTATSRMECFAPAVRHHFVYNDHHPEHYWRTKNENTELIPWPTTLEEKALYSQTAGLMSREAVVEMVVDWFAAELSYVGKWPKPQQWVWLRDNVQRKGSTGLHPQSEQWFCEILQILGFEEEVKKMK